MEAPLIRVRGRDMRLVDDDQVDVLGAELCEQTIGSRAIAQGVKIGDDEVGAEKFVAGHVADGAGARIQGEGDRGRHPRDQRAAGKPVQRVSRSVYVQRAVERAADDGARRQDEDAPLGIRYRRGHAQRGLARANGHDARRVLAPLAVVVENGRESLDLAISQGLPTEHSACGREEPPERHGATVRRGERLQSSNPEVGPLDHGGAREQRAEPRVSPERRLELIDAARGGIADRIVREAEHDPAVGLKVVLAQAIVREHPPVPVVFESVEFDGNAKLIAANRIVDPIGALPDLNLPLWGDPRLRVGMDGGRKDPPEERVLKERVGA